MTSLCHYLEKYHIEIVIALSVLCNPNEDEGILIGNWEGAPRGGSSLLSWTGSEYLMYQYTELLCTPGWPDTVWMSRPSVAIRERQSWHLVGSKHVCQTPYCS